MWIARKKFEELERKIAALEDEQLVIMKYVKEAMESDRELTEIVKDFREELFSEKGGNRWRSLLR